MASRRCHKSADRFSTVSLQGAIDRDLKSVIQRQADRGQTNFGSNGLSITLGALSKTAFIMVLPVK